MQSLTSFSTHNAVLRSTAWDKHFVVVRYAREEKLLGLHSGSIGLYRGNWGVNWDTGKENGNYYSGLYKVHSGLHDLLGFRV